MFTPTNQTSAIRIALILRDGLTYPSSSAFIRLLSPLTDRSMRGKLVLKIYPQNTTQIDQVDICIVQRTAFDQLNEAEVLINNLRSAGIPLVVDTDDAFHIIDSEHPEESLHRGALVAFDHLIKNANRVWVSTARLKSLLKAQTDKVIVIPNSLDKRIWLSNPTTATQTEALGPLRILYMGTVSHDADWEMIFPVLSKLADQKPESFELTVIGVSRDRPLRPWIKRLYQQRNGSIYPRFVPWFLKQGSFDVGLSPLVDSGFNLNKSDIKALDYLAAGAMPVVSNLEPYATNGLDSLVVRVNNSPQDWETVLAKLIADPITFRNSNKATLAKAQKYIWQERSSEMTAKLIYKQLLALTNKRP